MKKLFILMAILSCSIVFASTDAAPNLDETQTAVEMMQSSGDAPVYMSVAEATEAGFLSDADLEQVRGGYDGQFCPVVAIIFLDDGEVVFLRDCFL